MSWKKYNSIENTYNECIIDSVKNAVSPDELWVVSEKVDGSNGSYIINKNKTIKMAKRTCLIDDNSNFDGMRTNLEKYRSNFYKLFDHLSECFSDLETVIVYGENFGGFYPHPDVSKVKDVKKIQGRVLYHPDIEFIVFDILIIQNGESSFLSYFNFVIACSFAGLKTVPTLFMGNLIDALNYPNDFDTRIPAMYNLPTIEPNITEGVVIKPIFNRYFKNGERIILKNKNDIFSEVKHKKEKYNIIISEDMKTIFNDLENYITENRLHNIVSHFNEVTKEDFGKVLKEFSTDVITDYSKDNFAMWNKFTDVNNEKVIYKYVASKVADLMKKKFFNYVNEELVCK